MDSFPRPGCGLDSVGEFANICYQMKTSVFPRIALQIENNRAHGRELLKGIADYALEKTDWRLELVDPTQLNDVGYIRQFDGLIVRVMDDRTSRALVKSHKPVVDTYGRIDENPIPSIRLDDAGIAETAYRCFADHHYRTFAYCGFPNLRFSDARGEAFRAAAERNGEFVSAYAGASHITDAFFRDEKLDVPDARALGDWLVRLPKPIALCCCNDLRAVQVLKVCADRGIAVPDELAVMGVDNDVLLCTFAKPSLSSVETDSFALGRQAAELLDRQLQGEDVRTSDGKPRLWMPRRVVERMSTDVYPFKTPWLGEAVRYIRHHLAGGVTSAEVIRHLGYSHPKVNRAFIDELGHPVKKEILRQRNQLACALLRDTDCTLAEIANRCGKLSPQYFSYCFVEEFHATPDEWRKAHRA